jgi:hypothetical protein
MVCFCLLEIVFSLTASVRNNSHRVSLMSHSSQTTAGDTRLLDIRVSHPFGEVSGSTLDPPSYVMSRLNPAQETTCPRLVQIQS